jgi:hypothetical protein
MNNQIILSALNAQLDIKKAELNSIESTVCQPARQSLTSEVLTYLKDSVSPLINKISANDDRLEIFKAASPNSGWGGMTVSILSNWRSEDKKLFARMNWYGSSATVEDQNTLIDVEIFGAVASKLHLIEHEFINNWRPKFIEIDKAPDAIENEIMNIEHSIRATESQIKQEGIASYKKAGFACTISKGLEISRNWDDDNDTKYYLKDCDYRIQLRIGRSKWDYLYPISFKVLKTNNYKTTVEVNLNDDRVREYTVTAKSFNDFIEQVYSWETKGCQESRTKSTERFNNHYAKQETTA